MQLYPKIQDELRVFASTVMFFTVLPVPAFAFRPELLQRILRYSSTIGWVIGAIGAAIAVAAGQLWPPAISVGLALTATIIATGCFHEDGFADFCDGLATPGDRTAKLSAMRDSRLGFAGRIGAVAMLLARAGALLAIAHPVTGGTAAPALLASALIVGHSLGRFASALLVFDLQYARQADRDLPASGIKPAVTQMGPLDTLLAGTVALASLLLLPGVAYFWLPAILLLPYLALRVVLLRIFAGFTGDCLGAAQQIMELGVYLGIMAVTLWS